MGGGPAAAWQHADQQASSSFVYRYIPLTSLSLLQEVTCLATSKRLACIGTADGTFLVWDLLQVGSAGHLFDRPVCRCNAMP